MVIAANANAQAIASVVLRSMPRIDRQATLMLRKQHARHARMEEAGVADLGLGSANSGS